MVWYSLSHDNDKFVKGYVDEIYNTIVDAIENKMLTKAIEEIKSSTPSAMNTMLDKQPRKEAIEKKKARENMPIVDVPPTNPGWMFVSSTGTIIYISWILILLYFVYHSDIKSWERKR